MRAPKVPPQSGWHLIQVENGKVVSSRFLYICSYCHDKPIEPENGWTLKCSRCGKGETKD